MVLLLRTLLFITTIAVVSGTLVPLLRRESVYALPSRYEWQQARGQLRRIDRWRVVRATQRNQPISRAALAGAQLAYVRYRHDFFQRGHVPYLVRSRWLRTALIAIGGVVAAGYAAFAIAESQGRTTDLMFAGLSAMYTLSYWTALPRQRRLTERLAQLRAEIEPPPGMLPLGP